MRKRRYKTIAKEFQLSLATTKKYINMSLNDIQNLDNPRDYKKRKTIMDDYINIIYKMLKDGINDSVIYSYIKLKGYNGSSNSLLNYIKCIGQNNFRNKGLFNNLYIKKLVYPENIIVIKRNNLLKYLLTINPKIGKDKIIHENIVIIKEKYPVVTKVEEMFSSFHKTIMGGVPDELDLFINKYGNMEIDDFCEGLKKDITPAKNAISYKVSSGFVEGNNNKFKLIKRIVYGRSNLVNLSKKCFLAFSMKKSDFDLHDLI